MQKRVTWMAKCGMTSAKSPRLEMALAIRTADRMNNSIAIRMADCAAITRWR